MANESRPLFRPGKDITVLLTGNVTGKTFVDISAAPDATTGMLKGATAAAGAKALGVAAYDAVSGATVPVLRGGVVEVLAGAAITAGVEVEVNASGRAITLASGKSVGKACSSASANGDTIFVALPGA
jgi:hypothetical protein